jgi:hypothetical protein
MNNSEQSTEKMVQYLDGELAGEELIAFERSLAENPEMQAELANLKLAKLAVQHYGLKQQVASVHHHMMNELKNDPAGTRTGIYALIRSTMRIAAGLFILLFLFGLYEFIIVSPSKLSQENYRPYELSVDRGAAASSAIEKAYTNNDFKGVISNLEKNTNLVVKDHFLGAQAYLFTHQYAKAITEFNIVLHDTSGHYKDDAEYYLALSYLQNNEPVNAKQLLDKIYNDKDHLYHDRVTYWTMLKLKLLIIKNPGK